MRDPLTLSKVSGVNLLRFKHEFRALADVRHQNLIELFELDTRGQAFFTMELLEDARPFVAWIRHEVGSGQLPPLDRVENALQLLALGIAELHRLGDVHRDLQLLACRMSWPCDCILDRPKPAKISAFITRP